MTVGGGEASFARTLEPARLTQTLLQTAATTLAAMIARRDVSSVEVVRAHLDRISEINPTINAVVQWAPDALARAEAADKAVAADEALGPLHGVPFTAKDWLETQGLVCAAGFEERRDYRPARDAVVVARMRAAGAILLGKTNVTQGAPVYARPNNPADPARTPGSSSSGEAAIIAAGGSPMGLASDSGGSIRWPAHCCGVAGLKPTTGLVPSTGHFPRLGHLSDPRSTIGPMARSAADLEAMLRVIAGVDPGDPGTVAAPVGRSADVGLAGLVVGWFAGGPAADVTAETAAAVAKAADVFRGLGCAVTQIDAPDLDESMAITRAYWARRRSFSMKEWTPDGPARLSEDEIEQSIFRWERFSRRMASLMDGFDILLSPAAARPAPEHGAWGETEFLFTLPYSLTGQPVAVVRAGTSPEGLPIGVQIAARRWRDDVAIAGAMALEAAG